MDCGNMHLAVLYNVELGLAVLCNGKVCLAVLYNGDQCLDVLGNGKVCLVELCNDELFLTVLGNGDPEIGCLCLIVVCFCKLFDSAGLW